MVRGNEHLPRAGAEATKSQAHVSSGQNTIGDPPVAGRSSNKFADHAFHRISTKNIHGGYLIQAEFPGGKASQLPSSSLKTCFIHLTGSEACN